MNSNDNLSVWEKKYVSLTDDLQLLRHSLEQDPLQGVSLGMGEWLKIIDNWLMMSNEK